MVLDKHVGLLIAIAGILGVGFPVWATVEPWAWLAILGFSSVSWSLFALAIASYLILTRLNPQWLTLNIVSQVFPLPLSTTEALFCRLGRMQSTLLEIAAGADESEPGWRVTLRAMALVGLARHRVDANNSDLLQLADTLAERTRSPSATKGSQEETASLLSLLALASDDSDVVLGVVHAVHELVQDAIQRHQPVTYSLLDEASGLVTDRLQILLDSASIGWLATQEPIEQLRTGLLRTIPDGHVVPLDAETGSPELAIPDRVDWDTVRHWLDMSVPLERSEWKVFSALVPVYEQKNKHVPEESVKLIDVYPMAELDATQIVPESAQGKAGHRDDQAPHADDSTPDPALDGTEEDERSPEAQAAIVDVRHRRSDAYDLQEEGVSLLVSACAAPTPDDTTWPGGWRGIDALQEDIQRLSSINISLYEAGRYPPTDRVEQAIETIAVRVIRGRRIEFHAGELSSVTGWRESETALEHTTAHSAIKALQELAIAGWRAGFSRRSLLTIRRLVSIITIVVQGGDPTLLEDLDEGLQLSVIQTAKWTDRDLAERERSRQLVLSLAPEFMALGKAAQPQTDDDLWRQVFTTLDMIAWSPAGSEIEAATDIYLYFLSGIGAGDVLEAGGPWDVVAWERRPKCQPQELLPKVREHFLQQLRLQAYSKRPGFAILAVLALWRDLLVRDDRPALEAFRKALTNHVLDGGRREFEPPTLWSPSECVAYTPPQLEGPRIHWRLFDVAHEAHRWASKKLEVGEPVPVVLPSVTTPDADLRFLITTFGVEKLVDERQYWGIESGDDHFILVEEADRSRRLLRDCEGRAWAQFTWGYSGTGPDNLGAALVADMLGPLAYCPSCFGAIAAGGGLVKCPSCDGDGLRKNDLWSLQRACYYVITSLPKKPDPSLQDSEDVPSGAQWRMSRTEFLRRAFQLVDELDAEDESDRDPGDEA
jgi:hypothetical protein